MRRSMQHRFRGFTSVVLGRIQGAVLLALRGITPPSAFFVTCNFVVS
jgi:hypothetical protein